MVKAEGTGRAKAARAKTAKTKATADPPPSAKDDN
jgi:hypothetical protein